MSFMKGRIAGAFTTNIPDLDGSNADAIWRSLGAGLRLGPEMFGVTVTTTGHAEAAAYMKALPGALRSSAGRGAFNGAHQVRKLAFLMVPWKSGDLANSIGVRNKGTAMNGATAYDVTAEEAYAWFVHEVEQDYKQRDRAPQQPPTPYRRGTKYLERAANEVRPMYTDTVAHEISKLIALAKSMAVAAGVPQGGARPPRLVKGGSTPSAVFSKPLPESRMGRERPDWEPDVRFAGEEGGDE
ncbi:MAG: hypothetical protein E6R03_14900 [Hyphomicrobiaceae bacterium]|nr:MAG: hypothetical protein E6R03_14900 [Hyphomicrobiaceae bacterium]